MNTQLFRRLQNADPNASGGNAPSPTPPPPPPPPPSPPAAWHGDSHKEYVSNKGWKGADDVITSNINLEKLLGAEKAGRTVVLPKDDKDIEGIKALRSKLGVPDTADGYQLPVPDGDKGEFAKIASSWLHEAGVPKAAGQAIAAKWNAHLAEAMATAQAQLQAQSKEQLDGLKAEWGGDFEKKSEEARRFAKAAGFTDPEVKAIEEALGTANFLKRWAGLGAKLSEPGFVSNDGSSNASADARTKLEDLRAKRANGQISDSEWERLAPPLMELANKAA